MNLSIIIVNWNAKKYIYECLQSIGHLQTDHETEIIVVDNASSDGSQELILSEFPCVKLICNEENLGFAKANNIGIRNSTGKYIVFINSDVKVLNDCIYQLELYMNQHQEIGMLGPQILSPNGNVQRSCMEFPTIWNTFCRAMAIDMLFPKTRLFGGQMMTYWAHNTIRNVDVINGCFWMVRREALNDVGLLDEGFFIYAEDIDWCKRFWKAEWKVVFYPLAKAIHYGGGSSSNSPIRFYIELYRANYQYWQKHYSRSAQLIFLFITGLNHSFRLIGQIINYYLKPSAKNKTTLKIKRSIACIQWLLGSALRE